MTLQLPRHRFSVAEYDQMGQAGILDEDDRVELIEGEIVEMTPIGRRHAATVDRMAQALVEMVAGSAQVRVLGPIRLGGDSEPQPDLAVLRRKPDFYASGHPTAQDILLLVEVADSSADSDRQVKIPFYARHGVSEVWLVDLEAATITTYRDPSLGGFGTQHMVRRGEWLALLAFPGREMAVNDLIG
jgi:Uma2 family endonuclease